jgi:hypothetical protein
MPPRHYRLALKAALQEQYPNEDSDALLNKFASSVPEDLNSDQSERLLPLRLFTTPYSKRIDFTKDELQFNTDDFIGLTMDFAEQVGIDLKRYATNLTSGDKASEFIVGVALRTVFEVERHYVEVPGAFCIYPIPKQFLIVLGAAIIGIGTAKAAQLDPILAGSISGVGSLLINILAARYVEKGDQEVDWLEEFVLQVLEEYGIQSFKELREKTFIHPELLKKVLRGLQTKELVDEYKSWIDKTYLKYDLKGRH